MFSRKFLVLHFIAVCALFVACGAPDDSENGPVRIFNMSRSEVPDAAQHDVVHRVKTRGVGGYLARVFNDKNDVQLEAAQSIGINPIYSIKDAYHLKRPVKKIATCDDYYLDSLTHSMPYLVPEAADLLHDIGRAFTDTVLARGGRECQIKVTSLLRTENMVDKLKRRNVNASGSSCHMYGTTFDISWTRFNYCDPNYIMYTEDLQNILAEILFDMREQGRCYVKYERKQSCFHITAR